VINKPTRRFAVQIKANRRFRPNKKTMSRRLKVVYVSDPKHTNPWEKDILATVGPKHDLAIYDYNAPVSPQFHGVEVVIDMGGSWGTHAMADAAVPSVRLWQLLGTGFDHFDLPYWRGKGIPVANCPGQCSSIPLGECAMMYMLMLSRGWSETQANLHRGISYLPFGVELAGRSLGLIGFGASAIELARRARAFGMRLSAIDIRDISTQEQQEMGLEFAGKPADMDQVFAESDYISLHLHLNKETRHIVDARRLGLMKPSACLINVARGALVDEEALYNALTHGRLAGAGVDVLSREPLDPQSPLLTLSNVVATPHIAGGTDGTSRRRAAVAAENCDRIAAQLEPLYRIDR